MSKIDFQNVHTMIGADATVAGGISLEGGLIIYGSVQGSITTVGPVRIAKSGVVNGDIRASDIQIGGQVTGNITVKDRAVLGAQSELQGDLVYRRLLIEEGAHFEGRCDLISEENPPQPSPVTETSPESDASPETTRIPLDD